MSILMVCCCCLFTFSKKYISRVVIKFHVKHIMVGERMHKVFGLTGLELQLPWPIDNIKLP